MTLCQGCDKRTIEPNCHHPDRCEKWAEFETKKQARYKARADMAMLDAVRVSYDKGSTRYIPGWHPYIKKGGKNYVPPEEKRKKR